MVDRIVLSLVAALTLLPAIVPSAVRAEASPTDPFGSPTIMPEDLAEPSASEEAERLRAARRAQARDIDFFAPYYSVKDGAKAALFLMNTISDPIAVTVTALADEGGELPLGTYVIESLNHLEIPLREHLIGFEDTFSTGSLRLSLLGDADTLQGWMVMSSRDGETFEIPIQTSADIKARAFYSFWDTTISAFKGAGGIRFRLLNVSQNLLGINLTSGVGDRVESSSIELAAGDAVTLEEVDGRPFSPRGWLELQHDGEPGGLVMVGLVGSRHPVATLALVSVGEVRAVDHYESMPISGSQPADGVSDPGSHDTDLTVFNPGSEARTVTIDTIRSDDGMVVDSTSVALDPWEVRSVSLSQALSSAVETDGAMRLRVQSNAPPLLVQGTSRTVGGSATEVTFFPFDSRHANGTYPLPDREYYATSTTIVNLGKENSKIVAQVYWHGGTYALRPLTVPAGGTIRLSMDELAATAPPDSLGRKLDSKWPAGVLKWMVQEGSTELLGRTEAQLRTGFDRFGFNCYGCCWEYPSGAIVPTEVEFTPGESRDFEASVMYDTCSGTMGPFPASISSTSVPSPFIWNGSTITASYAADADITFEGEMMSMRPTCLSFLKGIFGFGRAKLCDKTFNPRGYDSRKTCPVQTGSCIECKACCNNIYQAKVCKGQDINLREAELRGCLTNCETDSCP